MQISGFIFIFGYIILLGIGTFLQKFSLKTLTAYQLHFLISIGMLITAVPLLFLKQKSLKIPLSEAPLGLFVGLLFASGSFLFTLSLTKLPVALATTLSLGYLVLVAVLSAIFLKEGFNVIKLFGMGLVLLGITILVVQTNK